MITFPLIRQCVLGAATLFSLIGLAISASVTLNALVIGAGVLSMLTLPVMLVIDIARRGFFTSMIVVELSWLGLLCILWVAAAGESLSAYNLIFSLACSYEESVLNGICQEAQASIAFSFLNFIILLLYTGALFVMAMIAASRGQSDIWLSSVKESFGPPAAPTQHSMTQHNTSEPQKPKTEHPTEVPV
ncbi:hypothetical protein HD554DRAFT_2046517 [Boletus coccyginus]|nr:hypothetical protein HD554DRAFT_2046517 [Boletus coccyginus]